MAERKIGQSDQQNDGTGNGSVTDSVSRGDSESTSGNGSESIGENFPVINPGDIITSNESGDSYGDDFPRKRGRPRGSKRVYASVTAKKEASLDLSGVLYSTHLMLAAMLKIEELKIEQTEAKELSDAIVRVNELYGGIVIPEKALAWINLGIVGMKVYGPRFAAHSLNRSKKKNDKPPAVTPLVFDRSKQGTLN